MSLTETGHYALANRIVALISSLAVVIYNAYQPSLQATFVNNDCEKRKNIMGGMTSGYIFFSYYSSSNRMIYMKDYLIASVFGVVLASVVAACFNMGVYGLVLSFSVSQIFNMFKWRKRCYRELGIRWIDAIKHGRKFACTEIFKWEKR